MAGEFRCQTMFWYVSLLLWSFLCFGAVCGAYHSKGVVPQKYLGENGPALGAQWGFAAALIGFAQVMSVVMYRTLASRPDPLASAADRFMVVASKALNNWVQ